MSAGKPGARILSGLLALGLAGSAVAQIAPRPTGTAVIAELEAAQKSLAVRAAGLPGSSLPATSQQLTQLVDSLRKALGNDADKPLDIIGKDAKSIAYRASAAAQRTQAYLDATHGCLGADAIAMGQALAATVNLLASASGSSANQPVVDAVETQDHRPLFLLRNSGQGVAFALTGANLFDAQCPDPLVSATNGQGKPQAVQPIVTGVLPNRIELKLPATGQLEPGSYVLHVATRHKAFLVGCTVQPEAIAAVQVAPPAKVSVAYALTAICHAGGGDHALPPVTGSFPDANAAGATPQRIVVNGCSDPVGYAITATVAFADGHSESVGPFSQIASAGITAGLPGGFALSWDPSVHELFVHASAGKCKGAY